jgi:phage gp36-like protein
VALYCNPQDLSRYGVNAAALADLAIDQQITPTIEAASDKIDSYLRSRYTLPLFVWGSDIRACCAIMAAWQTLRVRGLRPGENVEDSPLYLAYQEQLKWLGQIAGGTVHPEVTDSSSGAAVGLSADRPFIASDEQRGYHSGSIAGPLGGWRAGPFAGRRQS